MDEGSNENRIREWRLRRGLTLEALARDIGKDPSTLWRMETGRRNVTVSTLKDIGKVLDVSPAELVAKGGVKVSVIGHVTDGCHLAFYPRGQSREIDASGELTEQTVAIELRGCLGPMFAGWLAYYEDIRDPVSSRAVDRLCVVGLADDRIMVKQIKADEGRYHLFSNNTEPPLFDAAIAWAAPITRLVPGAGD